jgi:hypothetical protein
MKRRANHIQEQINCLIWTDLISYWYDFMPQLVEIRKNLSKRVTVQNSAFFSDSYMRKIALRSIS